VEQGRLLLDGKSLRSKLFRNVGWMAIALGCEMLIRLASSLILTRLLNPDAYGLLSTVMVLMVFVTMLSDLGIRPMVLADKRGDDKDFLSILWTMQAIRGFIIAAVVALLSLLWMHALAEQWIPPTSNYSDPLLPQLSLLICLSLVLAGFSSLNEFRLIRHLERGAITALDIGTRIFTTIITIGLAFAFRSVWAMALGLVVGSALRMALTHVVLAGPRMGFSFNWPEIKRIMTLSRWVALNSFITMATTQADKVLIGFSFGMSTLGIYTIAFTLYAAAASVVDQLNSNLGIPVLRALLDRPEAERRSAYYRFRLPIDVYCIAAGTLMVLFGALFFKLAYDPRYAAGGAYLAVLGIKIVLRPLRLSGNFLYAQLRYKLVSVIGIARSIVFLVAMGIAVWLESIHLMVVCIALEQLPETILYFSLRRTGIPFMLKRDGLLLGLAAMLGLYLLLT
jgi:O-antigen/teichoic acid export membrane protein